MDNENTKHSVVKLFLHLVMQYQIVCQRRNIVTVLNTVQYVIRAKNDQNTLYNYVFSENTPAITDIYDFQVWGISW